METKHTPGPWTVTADGAGWYIECAPERGHSVAYIMAEIGEEDPDTSDDEKEANARLIAAAPDLLALVLEMFAESEKGMAMLGIPMLSANWHNKAKTVIASTISNAELRGRPLADGPA